MVINYIPLMRKVLQKDSRRVDFKSLFSPRKVKCKAYPLSTIPTTVLDNGSFPYGSTEKACLEPLPSLMKNKDHV